MDKVERIATWMNVLNCLGCQSSWRMKKKKKEWKRGWRRRRKERSSDSEWIREEEGSVLDRFQANERPTHGILFFVCFFVKYGIENERDRKGRLVAYWVQVPRARVGRERLERRSSSQGRRESSKMVGSDRTYRRYIWVGVCISRKIREVGWDE